MLRHCISHLTASKNGMLSRQLSGMVSSRFFSSTDKPSDEETSAETVEEDPTSEPEEPNETEVLTKKVDELNDQLLRSLAEIENVRRIARQDVKNAREFSISKFAKGVLDVADNLQRAHESISIEELSEHSKENDAGLHAMKVLHEGVVMTDKLLQKVLADHHIVKLGQVGDVFNPNHHDAMFEFEDPDKQVGTIGQLIKSGYMINSRVLRPAQVGTIKAPAAN